MIETLTLITLSVLFLVFFRPGKTPPLNNPLVIDRPGKYHMTLAPHLNLAQPYVEAVARQLIEASERVGNSATQYFEIRDKQTTAHGHDSYLLAITQRDGILLFQAAAPAGDPLQTIRDYSQRVLEKFPSSSEPDAVVNLNIVNAAQQVARLKHIQIAQLG